MITGNAAPSRATGAPQARRIGTHISSVTPPARALQDWAAASAAEYDADLRPALRE
ncbi:hypothetical protein ACIBM3_22855 [Rhodococcus erythropolis]|uniref:hypothetical protein n=1 Tax=Rhodococcus erythropolis TaxID=1833 RepID=UPI0037A7E563